MNSTFEYINIAMLGIILNKSTYEKFDIDYTKALNDHWHKWKYKEDPDLISRVIEYFTELLGTFKITPIKLNKFKFRLSKYRLDGEVFDWLSMSVMYENEEFYVIFKREKNSFNIVTRKKYN